MASSQSKKAIVLVSGGLDSATVLAFAKHQGYDCYALSFNYGQRHSAELVAAEKIAKSMNVSAYSSVSLNLNFIGGSALTDLNIPVPEEFTEGIPVTYVPARNTIFLSIALGWAEVVQAEAIFIGVNAVDYSGYPDCRPDYIQAFQSMANIATRAGVEGNSVRIETPLIHLSKSEIIQMGVRLGLDYSLTISCYQATDQGAACGRCDSCRIRRAGFESLGILDPTLYV